MASSNTLSCVLLACCLAVGVLGYPQPQQPPKGDSHDHKHDHKHDHDHSHDKDPGSPCVPRGHHHDEEGKNPDSPNNFLPPVPGKPIEISDAPYMASIHDGDLFISGGVIISKWHVLAASVDLIGLDPKSKNYYVHERMGYSHRDHDGCSYRVAEITIHGPIALLKTLTPIHLVPKSIETIEIASPAKSFTPDATAKVIGWGHPRREDREGSSHTQLHILDVQMKNDKFCTQAIGDRLYNSKEMLCATGHDGCTGSSPLVQDGKVIGLVSSAFGCGEKDFPMSYISVANYHSWVTKEVEKA